MDENWKKKKVELPDYDQTQWRGQHAITVLMAKKDFYRTGEFDEKLEGWEDWDFFIRLAINGICGKRLDFPAFSYRKHTGQRRNDSFNRANDTLPLLRDRYSVYYDTGAIPMRSCCGGNSDAVLIAKQRINNAYGLDAPYRGLTEGGLTEERLDPVLATQVIRMEFVGDTQGAITFFGKEGRQYRGGANPHDRYADVNSEDVVILELSGKWIRL